MQLSIAVFPPRRKKPEAMDWNPKKRAVANMPTRKATMSPLYSPMMSQAAETS
ncbi:MAG: hypothetical protein ABJQ70_09885 [Roseobacter sp.]